MIFTIQSESVPDVETKSSAMIGPASLPRPARINRSASCRRMNGLSSVVFARIAGVLARLRFFVADFVAVAHIVIVHAGISGVAAGLRFLNAFEGLYAVAEDVVVNGAGISAVQALAVFAGFRAVAKDSVVAVLVRHARAPDFVIGASGTVLHGFIIWHVPEKWHIELLTSIQSYFDPLIF